MLTMTRTEAIPYASMKAGMSGIGRPIPQYLDSLDRAPKGVNCIQYMPTASLMIYVMGLEAAKTRPATEAERAEMRRLLNEGMDAGPVRIFDPAARSPIRCRPTIDGSPMVTDTMCDEDILNLARVLRERDEGFIEITQATGHIKDDLAFVETSGRRGAAADSLPGDRADAPRPRNPSPQPRWLEAMPREGTADFRPGRDAAHRLRLHPRTLEPLRREPGLARR